MVVVDMIEHPNDLGIPTYRSLLQRARGIYLVFNALVPTIAFTCQLSPNAIPIFDDASSKHNITNAHLLYLLDTLHRPSSSLPTALI
jgi:hypothetical protein